MSGSRWECVRVDERGWELMGVDGNKWEWE